MLIVNKTQIDDLDPSDLINIKYFPVNEENKWKIDVIKELLEIQYGSLTLEDFKKDDIKDMINILCTI